MPSDISASIGKRKPASKCTKLIFLTSLSICRLLAACCHAWQCSRHCHQGTAKARPSRGASSSQQGPHKPECVDRLTDATNRATKMPKWIGSPSQIDWCRNARFQEGSIQRGSIPVAPVKESRSDQVGSAGPIQAAGASSKGKAHEVKTLQPYWQPKKEIPVG